MPFQLDLFSLGQLSTTVRWLPLRAKAVTPFLFVLFGVSILGTPSCVSPVQTDEPSVQPECITDDQCDSWEICLLDRCTLAPNRCITSDNCLDDNICIEGICTSPVTPEPDAGVAECGEHNDCVSAMFCQIDGTCQPIGACGDAGDCTTLYGATSCIGGICIRINDVTPTPDPTPSPEPDAGTTEPDPTPAPEPDAGTTEPDPTPAPAPDAGTTEPDPTPPADAGAPSNGNDAGIPPEPDAGTPSPDAGMPSPDPEPSDPPPRGSYVFERLPIGGLDNTRAVAMHPSGTYALILENYDDVHLLDTATMTTTKFDLSEAGELLYLRDVAFSADGETALLVGKGGVNSDSAAVIRFDHAPYALARAATATLVEDDLFTRLSAPPGQSVDAIQWGFKDKYMMLFSTASNASSATAMLRTYDPVVEEWVFVSSQFMGAGCDGSGGLALVDNNFSEPGALVVCGRNGTSQAYYEEVGGFGDWVLDVIGNISNTSLAIGSPARDEGLVIANAKLYQFASARINSTYAQFSSRSMQGFAYQPNGRRVLVVGKLNPGYNNLLEAMEYRPPLFESCALGCELTDVSVPAGNFAVADDAYLWDVAWMHHCDGGVAVGGKSTFNSSVGYVFTFQVENGISCGF